MPTACPSRWRRRGRPTVTPAPMHSARWSATWWSGHWRRPVGRPGSGCSSAYRPGPAWGAGPQTPPRCSGGPVAVTWASPPASGADVPFCVAGGRALRHGGSARKVTALPFEERTYVLVLPPFGVDTAAVYRALRPVGRAPRRRGPNRTANDLLAAALEVEPRLAVLAGRGAGPRVDRPGWPAAVRRGSSKGRSTVSTPERTAWLEQEGEFAPLVVRPDGAGTHLILLRPKARQAFPRGTGPTCRQPASANGWPSASSCASSCACACGAS